MAVTEIRLSKNELDSMLKNAEQDGRINSIESKLSDHVKLLNDIFTEVRSTKQELATGYATVVHVDEEITKAVQGERLLIRVALWGMGIAFMVVMPLLSYLLMNELSTIYDYMKKNEQFQMRIERHISDGHKHDVR